MRLLPRATVELIAELHGLADLLDDTLAGMNPESSSPYGMAQGRVYAATCRLAAVRLEELAYTLEELAPLVQAPGQKDSMLIPNPRLNSLAKLVIEASVAHEYSDPELLVVVTFLQDHLLKGDRPLRAIVGSIVNTGDHVVRGRFLVDLIGMCQESDPSVH